MYVTRVRRYHTVEDAALAKKLVSDLDLQALSPKTASILLSLLSIYGKKWCTEMLTIWTNSKSHWNSPSKCNAIASIIKHFSKNTGKDSEALIVWLLSYQSKQLKTDHQAAIKDQSITQRLRTAPTRIKEIMDFIRACLYANQNTLAIECLNYIMTHPETYPALALIKLLDFLQKQLPPSKLEQWHYPQCLAYVINQLNDEHAKGIRAEDDWSIKEKWGCTCGDCITLKKFLKSRTSRTLRWPLAKARRAHIHRTIDGMCIPVTHKTEHTGSPHKLILTKTHQLHRQAKQRFKQLDNAFVALKKSIKNKKQIKSKHYESTTT